MQQKINIDENLTIEKREAPKAKMARYSVNNVKTKKVVNANEIIDTAFSYLIDGLEIKENGKGHNCIFCGKETSYSNRYICPECWAKKNKDMLKALKEKNQSIIVNIE